VPAAVWLTLWRSGRRFWGRRWRSWWRSWWWWRWRCGLPTVVSARQADRRHRAV